MTTHVRGLYRAPFSDAGPKRLDFTPGLNVSEMVALACLPSDFREYGTVLVGGYEIPQDMWSRVKPKVGHSVTFHYFPFRGGGGRSGTKAALGVALAIATVLTAGAASAGMFQLAGGLFAKGSISAHLLGTCISPMGTTVSELLT